MVRLSALGQHAIFLIKCLGQFIATEFHLLEFVGLPAVHFEGADERYVDAHTPMVSSALVAQEDADVSGAPFWVLAAAVEANFVLGIL